MFTDPLHVTGAYVHHAWMGYGSSLMGLLIFTLVVRDILAHGDFTYRKLLTRRLLLFSGAIALDIVCLVIFHVSGSVG